MTGRDRLMVWRNGWFGVSRTIRRPWRLFFLSFVVALLTLSSNRRVAADRGGVSDEWIMTMVHRHCAMCYSENPSHTMLLGQPPPKGVVLESIEDVRGLGPRIIKMVVWRKFMPFGNETGMADSDRDRFGQWIAAQ